jgi:hypothetical protein
MGIALLMIWTCTQAQVNFFSNDEWQNVGRSLRQPEFWESVKGMWKCAGLDLALLIPFSYYVARCVYAKRRVAMVDAVS